MLAKRGILQEEDTNLFPVTHQMKRVEKLVQLRREHDREIKKLEEELDKKLDQAEREFRREAAKENKRDKIDEKRLKLEAKEMKPTLNQ
jgi:hypothetical protein